MSILQGITDRMAAIALREVRELEAEGYSESDIKDIVLENTELRLAGVVAGLTSCTEDRERAYGIVANP